MDATSMRTIRTDGNPITARPIASFSSAIPQRRPPRAEAAHPAHVREGRQHEQEGERDHERVEPAPRVAHAPGVRGEHEEHDRDDRRREAAVHPARGGARRLWAEAEAGDGAVLHRARMLRPDPDGRHRTTRRTERRPSARRRPSAVGSPVEAAACRRTAYRVAGRLVSSFRVLTC